jgi:hypothetical protein
LKHSRSERERRAREVEDVRRIEGAWRASLAPDVAASFANAVAEVRARGPLPKPPDMPPGTRPNPPRPGHEPRPPKESAPTRRPR